jgi:hypothetical protein
MGSIDATSHGAHEALIDMERTSEFYKAVGMTADLEVNTADKQYVSLSFKVPSTDQNQTTTSLLFESSRVRKGQCMRPVCLAKHSQ